MYKKDQLLPDLVREEVVNRSRGGENRYYTWLELGREPSESEAFQHFMNSPHGYEDAIDEVYRREGIQRTAH